MGHSAIHLRDRFLGCLLGCAVGDALGAPYEGLWSHSIPNEETLLAGFADFEGYPRGQYTDDTQLSMATVEAIVKSGDVVPAEIARSIAKLWKNESVVGPGGACTQAAHRFLKTGDWASCGAPVGQAGNGTAMRTAVLGLFFLHDPQRLPGLVADVSRITHQDPRSVAGGVAIAKAAQLLATGDILPVGFCEEIAAVSEAYEPAFAQMVCAATSRLMVGGGDQCHSARRRCGHARGHRRVPHGSQAWAGNNTPAPCRDGRGFRPPQGACREVPCDAHREQRSLD